jgi:hypothetical protein
MGRVPIELVEKILVHADLEIGESLRRALPRERSVAAAPINGEPCWGRSEAVVSKRPLPLYLPSDSSAKRLKLQLSDPLGS